MCTSAASVVCVRGRCAKISKVFERKEKDLDLLGVERSQGFVVSAWPSLWKSQTCPFQPPWLSKPGYESLKTIAFLWVYSLLWSCCQSSSLWIFLTGKLLTWPKSAYSRSSQGRKHVTVFHIPFSLPHPSRQEKTSNASFPSTEVLLKLCSYGFVLPWSIFCTFLMSARCRAPWNQQTPSRLGCSVPHRAWADQPEVFDPLCWHLCCRWGRKCSRTSWSCTEKVNVWPFRWGREKTGWLVHGCSRLGLFARSLSPESFEECRGDQSALWFSIMLDKNTRAAKLSGFFFFSFWLYIRPSHQLFGDNVREESQIHEKHNSRKWGWVLIREINFSKELWSAEPKLGLCPNMPLDSRIWTELFVLSSLKWKADLILQNRLVLFFICEEELLA